MNARATAPGVRPESPPARRRWLWPVARALAVGLAVAGVAADPVPDPSRLITSYQQLWAVPPVERSAVFPVRLEFLVYYHDAAWKVAWGQCAGTDNFLSIGPVPFVVRPGQRILVEGEVIPAHGMQVTKARYTRLGEPELLPPAPATAGRLDDVGQFDQRRVTVVGKVVGQTLVDSTHLTLDFVSDGRPCTVHLRLDGWTAPPELKGAEIRIKAVYSGTNANGELKPKVELWVHEVQDIEIVGGTALQPAFRSLEQVITNLHEFERVPDALRDVPQRVRFDYLVYFHDPIWKVAWGSCGGINHYLTLAELPWRVKPGQRIRIEDQVVPARGLQFGPEATYTLLGEEDLPPPLITQDRVRETGRFDNQPVIMEGYVDRQTVFDSTHLKVYLVSEGWPVVLRLLLPGDKPPPRLEGLRLRVKGVYSATVDPTAATLSVALWVQGTEDIEVIGSLADDEQFRQEAIPIEKIPTAAAGPRQQVKIVGAVRRQQPGASLTVRDETGQVLVRTVQMTPVPVGAPVEVIGYPAQEPGGWVLREATYRPSMEPLKELRRGLTRLRLAEQLLELSPEEAARGYPVTLNGIVTWTAPAADFCYIRDASGGVRVMISPEQRDRLEVGSTVSLSGTTRMGRFVPEVVAASLERTAKLELPEAKEVTLAQALTGVEEAQWVSMSGYVRQVAVEGAWRRLELTTVAGRFAVFMPLSEQGEGLRGSVIRVRGVCSAVANRNRQLEGIVVWVTTLGQVQVEEPEPADPFAVDARSIASLRQFNAPTAINRRVRVGGVVTHHRPGHLLHIQEGSDTLEILSQGTEPVQPGDRIEAVGFPGRENNRVVLREAVYRRMAAGPEPEPQGVDRLEPLDLGWDGRLVRIPADLLEYSAQGQSVRLVAQSGRMIFEALLDDAGGEGRRGWMPGSRVALTGIYQVKFDEYRQPRAMQLQLRSGTDVAVLVPASWWTAPRALAAAGVLAAGILLGVGWVVVLRRRVRQQTGQIREQVESEKAARLDAALARASKLESLGVLAGGIAHDFNNLLTVVLGNLSMARLDAHIEADNLECLKESERAALRARDLTQQLITFAKGGEPVRSVIVLSDVVREAAGFALHGAKVRCDFDLAPDLWPVNADKGQISQVVHNLMINAVHAMPTGGVIRVTLGNDRIEGVTGGVLPPGHYAHLTIADAGSGIAPEQLSRIFDPYFTTKTKGNGLGLASVYSIIKRHEGHIEVKSKVGEGTTFQIWLPARPAEVVAEVAAEAETKPRGALRARLLLMDDDPAIRQLGGGLIRRLGLDHTAVADGVEMLREYVAARTAGRPYDLVVLDLTVPGGMGGAEAMARLLEVDPKARVVVSSGYSNDPVMANHRAHGFVGMVAKPYVFSEFMKVIVPLLTEREPRT